MRHFYSNQWVIFAESPTSLFKREFIKLCYLYVDELTHLKVIKLLVIGEKDHNSIYVSKREDKKNYSQIVKDYKNNKTKNILSKLNDRAEGYQMHGKNLLEKNSNFWRELGPIVIYTYYLERLLTAKFKQLGDLTRTENEKIKKLIGKNGELREKIAQRGYGFFNKSYPKLRQYHNSYIDYYLIDELISGKRIDRAEIEKRKKFFTELITKERVRIYTGQAAFRFLKREGFKEFKVNRIESLNGFCAYPGKITGQAVIIRKKNDFDEKKAAGRILISPRTVIEYNPYFKQVKAIITDMGGINCHAAITAREYKKPCIVGTKYATQIFKDGDKVEVDADQGIVRKIK